MRFVKATEKLPKHDWPIHVKIDGIPFIGNFYNVEPGGAVWFYVSKGLESWSIPPEKFNGIEWLCEDAQDEGWVPVEKFADFLDAERNKGLEGRGKDSLWNDTKIWGKTTAFKLMLEKFKERQPPATT